MLSRRPVLTALGVDTSTDDSISQEMDEILDSAFERRETFAEYDELPTTSQAVTPTPNDATTNSIATAVETPLGSTPRNSFRSSKKNTYEKVVQKFTNEWTTTQNNILSQMKQEDEMYLGKVADVLQQNREETAKILDKDREETVKLFQNFITNMRAAQIQQPVPFAWTPSQYGHFQINPSSTSFVCQNKIINHKS